MHPQPQWKCTLNTATGNSTCRYVLMVSCEHFLWWLSVLQTCDFSQWLTFHSIHLAFVFFIIKSSDLFFLAGLLTFYPPFIFLMGIDCIFSHSPFLMAWTVVAYFNLTVVTLVFLRARLRPYSLSIHVKTTHLTLCFYVCLLSLLSKFYNLI